MIESSRGPNLNTSIVLPHALYCARGAGPTARGAPPQPSTLLGTPARPSRTRARLMRTPERRVDQEKRGRDSAQPKNKSWRLLKILLKRQLTYASTRGSLVGQRNADRPPLRSDSRLWLGVSRQIHWDDPRGV